MVLKGGVGNELRVNSIQEMDRAVKLMQTTMLEDEPNGVRFVRIY
jgi:hypothetical protein